tara:strand:+ start:438 stop:902 length:465 start_codon:yes stop_codon:yes gene_type:complete
MRQKTGCSKNSRNFERPTRSSGGTSASYFLYSFSGTCLSATLMWLAPLLCASSCTFDGSLAKALIAAAASGLTRYATTEVGTFTAAPCVLACSFAAYTFQRLTPKTRRVTWRVWARVSASWVRAGAPARVRVRVRVRVRARVESRVVLRASYGK